RQPHSARGQRHAGRRLARSEARFDHGRPDWSAIALEHGAARSALQGPGINHISGRQVDDREEVKPRRLLFRTRGVSRGRETASRSESTAMSIDILPHDAHNARLLANAHPPDWANPEPAPRYNLVVLGAGTAGLVTAAGAAGLDAKVALVERYLM